SWSSGSPFSPMSFFAGRFNGSRHGGATTEIAPRHVRLTRAPTRPRRIAQGADTLSDVASAFRRSDVASAFRLRSTNATKCGADGFGYLMGALRPGGPPRLCNR